MGNEDDEFKAKCGCGCCVFSTFFIIFFVFPFVFFTSEDTEIIVLYSKLFARFEEDVVESGGFHSKPYNARAISWSRVEQTTSFEDLECNSADGLLITMDLSYQALPDPSRLIELTRKFRNYKRWDEIMTIEAESAVRNVCGDYIADDFQTIRGEVATAIEAEVKNTTSEKFGAIVTKLQLIEVQRPDEYEQAVVNKENARSEISLAENEREQALTQALTTVDVANQEAVRIIDTAETTAQVTLNEADAQFEAIIDRFTQLAAVYSAVKSDFELTSAGILTYISNDIFVDDVTIAVEAPVELNFKDEL